MKLKVNVARTHEYKDKETRELSPVDDESVTEATDNGYNGVEIDS